MSTPETKLVAIDGTDALAFVIVRPGPQEGGVSIEAGARGLGKVEAARVLRHVADLWDARTEESGKDTGDGTQPPAGESTQPSPAELLALATVLEIPRPGTGIPFQLRRSHGHTDRWAICDRTGRRWYREQGWMYEPDDDRLCDDGRFTLTEAVPLARQLAEVPACGRCHHAFDPTDTRFDGRAQHGDTPFCRRCVDRCHEATDAFHRCAVCISPTEAGEAR